MLTEVDDLLDEVGVRLTQEGEDLDVKYRAKQAEDAEMRRKMATVAKRAEEMAERQEQHVKAREEGRGAWGGGQGHGVVRCWASGGRQACEARRARRRVGRRRPCRAPGTASLPSPPN